MLTNQYCDKDPVSVFLRATQRKIRPAYFGQSEVLIGHEMIDDALRVVYRLEEDGVLLICSVALTADTSEGAASHTGAVRKLVKLLREIETGVPAVQEMHGLVIEDVWSPKLREERIKLRRIYEACGAHPVEIDGLKWMVYRTRQKGSASISH